MEMYGKIMDMLYQTRFMHLNNAEVYKKINKKIAKSEAGKAELRAKQIIALGGLTIEQKAKLTQADYDKAQAEYFPLELS